MLTLLACLEEMHMSSYGKQTHGTVEASLWCLCYNGEADRHSAMNVETNVLILLESQLGFQPIGIILASMHACNHELFMSCS